MIHVKKPELAADQAWNAVVAEAMAGRASLISAFDSNQDLKVDDRLYKKYMRFLLNLFHNKCAYCESKIGENQPGDVEHYRPKGRVMGDDSKPVQVDHPVKGHIPHPGYYWLAYDWSNLFPSCIDCNRARGHGEGKERAGKADRFPVEDYRACVPGKEKDERALLLNPSEVDPADHLQFMPDGKVKARTRIGERTIKELGLNLRETLVEQRRLAFSDARRIAEGYVQHSLSGFTQKVDELRPEVDSIRAGSAAFAAIRRMSFNLVVDEMSKAIKKIQADRFG